MTDTRSHHRHERTAALAFVLLVAVLLATGLAALAYATETRATPRPAAITGSIHLKRSDVQSGGTVGGEVEFQNRTSKTKVLMRGCKIDALFDIGVRASDGYAQAPAFSLVGCSPEQELVARPDTTIYRFDLRAIYTSCSQKAQDQPPGGSKYWMPLCRTDSVARRDIMPPLPPGQYTALFFPSGEWHGPRVQSTGLVVTRKKQLDEGLVLVAAATSDPAGGRETTGPRQERLPAPA
ncbi:MAG: hypothetical protein ACLP01_19605 [Solirubrobacteraceae bacterium]